MTECYLQTADPKRKIESLQLPGENRTYHVGGMVESIRLVSVAGNGAYVPWYEVKFTSGELAAVNATYVECVTYSPEPTVKHPVDVPPNPAPGVAGSERNG